MPKPFLPPAFERKMRELLADDFDAFWKCCQTKSPRFVRPNRFRIMPEQLHEIFAKYRIELEPTALGGVFVVKTANVRLGLLPEHRDGLFVVQDVSSMIPAMVLDPNPLETVLDLAAAPGMKTVQMAEGMQNQGAIVAVDSNRERLSGLRFNLNRLGIINTLVVQSDGRTFSAPLFDKVLLDAPCSSEGVVRKRTDALRGWSQNLVEKKSALQKQLVLRAFSLLKPNGTLLYSTCTFSPEENEEVVQFLLEKNPNAKIQSIELNDFVVRKGLTHFQSKQFDSGLQKTARVYPQDNDSEAFFVAKIKKVSA